jgi:hypothetical protein
MRHELETRKESSVDPTTFDALLRRVARQTTRRAALASLLGGALLLHAPAASDATREAKRRKHRKRRLRARASILKPISIHVDNRLGTNTLTVEARSSAVEFIRRKCCVFQNRISIPPGVSLRFDFPHPTAYVWIADVFWFEFVNVPLERPGVTIAVNGSPSSSDTCCPPIGGITRLRDKPMGEGASFPTIVNGYEFRVKRHNDTNYKVFSVTLPSTL